MASKSLGTLTIDLIAKIGGLSSGLDKGERKLKSFKDRAVQVGRDVAAGLAVIGTAAAGMAAIVIANTIEAEKAQAQLAAAIKSTGSAAGLTQQQLNGMADELSSLTTFEDDAITSAQALLLTFTKIGGEVFPHAIRAAADMSIALGTDLQSAVTQLGKSLNDPMKGITALGRAGVQFSEDQKSMIEALVETGRLADAQRIILGELETQFGGSAVAARDTFGGALEALKNTVGNLLEGDSGSDGLQAAKQAVEDLNTQLGSAEVRSQFAAAIEEAANQLSNLVSWAIKWDQIAGKMRGQANTGDAFAAYGDSLAGINEDVENLKANIAFLEEDSLNPFAAALRPGLLEDYREQLAKKQAIIDHFRAQDLAREKEHVAAVVEVARSAGAPMLSGETQVIGAGDSQFEFGLSPRGGSGARKKEHVQTAAEYRAELRKLADEEKQQMARWAGMVAQLEGPLAEAQFAHEQRIADLKAAAKEAGASSADLAAALDLENAAHEKNVASITARLDPLSALLRDMDFERELLGLTNTERVAELELRELSVDMTPEEIAAARARIKAKAEEYEALQQTVSAMDDFRSSFEDNVAGVLDGSESISDAFRDMVDDVIAQLARMTAQNFGEWLFGQQGQSGGGLFGDVLGSLFGAFGGNTGGGLLKDVIPPGKSFALTSEAGPAVVMPSGGPIGKSAANGRGATIVQNFNMPGRYDLRTQAQVSADAGRSAQRAIARSTA